MSHVFSCVEVKKAREAAKLSAAAVAAAVGLNRTYYGLYEAGRYVLSDSQQSTIAAFFNKHLVLAAAVKPSKPKEESASTPQSVKSETLANRVPARRSENEPNKLPPAKLSEVQIAVRRLSNLEQVVAVDKTTGRHTARSIQCLLASLQTLAYAELFKLTELRGIPAMGISSPTEYELLNAEDQHKKVEQLGQIIVCHALYGKVLQECDRRNLYKIICQLRRAFPTEGALVAFPSLFEELFESASEAANTTSNLRAEVAGHLLKCSETHVLVGVPS